MAAPVTAAAAAAADGDEDDDAALAHRADRAAGAAAVAADRRRPPTCSPDVRVAARAGARCPTWSAMTEKEARRRSATPGSRSATSSTGPTPTPAQRCWSRTPNRRPVRRARLRGHLVVSSGRPLVTVPYVIGQPRAAGPRDAARPRASTVIGPSASPTSRAARSLETDPAARRQRARGQHGHRLLLRRARGGARRRRPDSRTRAEQTLRDAGFEVDVVETTDTTEPRGTVIRQSPQGGQEAAEGSTVTIVVSAFEEPSRRPQPRRPSETPPTETESPTGDDLTRRCRPTPRPSRPVGGRLTPRGSARSARRRCRFVRPSYAGASTLLGAHVPADRDVGHGGRRAVAGEVVVLQHRRLERGRVADRRDHVGLRVGHALQHARRCPRT